MLLSRRGLGAPGGAPVEAVPDGGKGRKRPKAPGVRAFGCPAKLSRTQPRIHPSQPDSRR